MEELGVLSTKVRVHILRNQEVPLKLSLYEGSMGYTFDFILFSQARCKEKESILLFFLLSLWPMFRVWNNTNLLFACNWDIEADRQ